MRRGRALRRESCGGCGREIETTVAYGAAVVCARCRSSWKPSDREERLIAGLAPEPRYPLALKIVARWLRGEG